MVTMVVNHITPSVQDVDQWLGGNTSMGSAFRFCASFWATNEAVPSFVCLPRGRGYFDRNPWSLRPEGAPGKSLALTGRPSYGTQAIDYESCLLKFAKCRERKNKINLRIAEINRKAPCRPVG